MGAQHLRQARQGPWVLGCLGPCLKRRLGLSLDFCYGEQNDWSITAQKKTPPVPTMHLFQMISVYGVCMNVLPLKLNYAEVVIACFVHYLPYGVLFSLTPNVGRFGWLVGLVWFIHTGHHTGYPAEGFTGI